MEVEFDVPHLFQAINNTALMRVVTGSYPIKVVLATEATGQCHITIDKGTTYTDDGTEITVYKRKETDDRTTTVTAYHTPTVDSSGTTKEEGFISGGGRGANKIGGKVEVDGGLIWEANSDHLIKVTNTSGGDVDIFNKVLIEELR